MDAKFILDSALVCDNNCNECDFKDLCYVDNATRNSIITIHDYYEQKLKAERAKVMQEVRAHVHRIKRYSCLDKYLYIEIKRLESKLDSMEDK